MQKWKQRKRTKRLTNTTLCYPTASYPQSVPVSNQ